MSVLPDSFYRGFDFYAPQWIYMETILDRAAMDVTAMWWEERLAESFAKDNTWRVYRLRVYRELDKGRTENIVKHGMELISVIISGSWRLNHAHQRLADLKAKKD